MSIKQTFFNLSLEKQKRITDCAIQEFAEKGYHQASINQIIAQSAIAKGSLYQYFDNKESLFLYIAEYGIRQIKDCLHQAEEQVRAEDDIFTKIKTLFLSLITFVKNHPAIFRLYLKTVMEGQVPHQRELIQQIHLSFIEYLTPLLDEAGEKGEIQAKYKPRLVAFLLDTVIDRFLQVYLDPNGEFRLDESDNQSNLLGHEAEFIKNILEVIEIFKYGLAG